mmetsp:Transcript_20902/g.45314  ORF Transcript_20902/g.45314 Transcript_20902/m.45314 type:complete len:3366 (+) Transcript_20902:339-10436(+)|eukprot:CAMPEP_0172307514 /NCGR_PEP_ID=MMETSP1058-20130122/8342_1 /TAXON_ID=83371 /ORGANISM="Detonula confervacea, Strain CCMP 353" /LENGTH=3365 /DNA_ID=CAMNT_0013019695 /DNA_START=286 /DNA_END=10383 /DNA_ORIENTATION=+
MDFLPLESALLLQGGDTWSLDPTAPASGGTDGPVDGSSSIIGPSNIVGSSTRGVGGYYCSSDHNVAKLPTPLDPLLKYLKREYASSAGPQDVLASTISAKELECLLNETGTAWNKGGKKPPAVIMMTELEPSPVGREIEGRAAAPIHPTTTTAGQIWATSSVPAGATVDDVARGSWAEGSRAATPLASGTGRTARAVSTTSLHSEPSPLHSSHHALHQQQKRRRMPSFCHSPPCHIDNLLQTTPHLRHLSVASTDMSGAGVYDESKNVFAQLLGFKGKGGKSSAVDNGAGIDSSSASGAVDYHTSLLRQRGNLRASLELASFMRLLSNEMPQDIFAAVESEVFSKVFSLVHSKALRADDRLAGVAALDALLTVPSANEERRAIRFGNNLSNGLKAAYADYEFLHAIARALGRMAMGAANVDRVEFEIGRSLEWLRSDRSDRRLAAVLVLRELARCAPTAFYSKTHNVNVHHHAATAAGSSVTGGGPAPVARDGGAGGVASHLAGLGGTNDFLDHIFPVLRDPQPIVRVCAADALSECLTILMERQQRSMTAPLCTLYANMMEGLAYVGDGPGDKNPPPNGDLTAFAMTAAVHAHGSLLVVSEMLKHSQNFILPRFDEVCVAVLKFMKHDMILIQLEVTRLIPKLAQRCPEVYGRRYLNQSLEFLIASAATSPPARSRIVVKPAAFMSIGQLALAMSDEAMGGGDITIPLVRIVSIEYLGNMVENDDIDYHLVELKDESDFQEKLADIFSLISDNLKWNVSKSGGVAVISGCFANFVEALGVHAAPYVMEIVEDMFDLGLSEDLIKCLHSIGRSIPSKQLSIERRLFEEISFCLAGKTVDLFSIKENNRPTLSDQGMSSTSSINSSSSLVKQPTLERNFMSSISLSSMNPGMRPKKPQSELEVQDAAKSRTETAATNSKPSHKSDRIVINKSTKRVVVDKLVLSLRTLRTIGESYMQVHASEDGNMLLPFLRNVISMYFDHPSSDVRREAAITCCLLLLPFGNTKEEEEEESLLRFKLGDVSGSFLEEILQKLLRMAVSDLSPVVRLCIVHGLDERYDAYLSLSLLAPLFLMLEDEALAVRACALQILGRLSRLNPAPILPGLRRVLMNLIIELRCGGDNGGGREVATRLIIIFLREEALQRLSRPFISSIIDALPLANVAPRLATASLEALGELATVANGSINPWLRQLISHILENIQDQNSSKQRVSLWALGKIAFGTSYVVSPYLDYPQLLTQASDILSTTKKASWDLRREVFRTFGILGALDPDRFGSGSSRKGGGKGGGYFVELEDEKGLEAGRTMPLNGSAKRMAEWSLMRDQSSMISSSLQSRNISSNHAELRVTSSGTHNKQTESGGSRTKSIYQDSDDEPAALYMYEQYAMTAQPLSKLSPARRLSPSDEAFYPTVTIQALMRILKDSSLSNLHGMVMKAVMFIFNALGLKSVPFLEKIVPHILVTVKNCGQHGLREALLQQVANLSAIVREHLRPYLPAIFEVVEEFWFSRHLSALCSLIERVATAVPDDFRAYVPLLVRQALASIEAIDLTEWSDNNSASGDIERLQLILKHIQGIKGVLGEYIHLVVPALVKLSDALINPDPDEKNMSIQISPSSGSRSKLTVKTIETLSILLQTIEGNPNFLVETSVKSNSALPARVVQPFLRLLGGNARPNKEVGNAIIGCICICVRQLGAGRWLSFYHETARDAITAWQTRLGIERLQEEQGPSEIIVEQHLPLPIDLYDEVVNEITSISSARWEMWNGSSNGEDVSRGEFSLGRSGASEVSLPMMGESLKTHNPAIQPILHQTAHKTNISNLQKAWDVSQRSTREDWDEWMRRFSVQLLREAPSPALRACAELAQAYQPLARELFSAAFVCCWGELNDQYRSNLVFSLEVVFSADASLEILQSLLNLAEFMEHDFDSKGSIPGLSIDISILAELALKCRAYARALHYKEREYIMGRGGSCVEQLIDINKKLDLPEAALGVLKAAKIEIERRGGRSLVSSKNRAESRPDNMAYSVMTSYGDAAVGDHCSWAGDIIYESWLAKLGSWAEALLLYEEKLRENPHDINSILGCLQCYGARGEWQKALDLAGRSWGALSGDQPIESNLTSWQSRRTRKKSNADNYKQALKCCAQSAWRLGKWDELETYSSQLVQGLHSTHNYADTVSSSNESRATNSPKLDFDGAFYRAVLHIHRAEWDDAAKSIDSARKAMDSRFTALLAESYKRAYPSMVSAQLLSELEEIISFRQFEMRTNSGIKLHAANRPDAKQARQHLLNVWRQRLDGCRIDAEVHSSILAVRSLVLTPTDEVEATITLSDLSRQAQAYQLAERTLLDPLAQMKCSLNSPFFGVGIPSNLGLGLALNPGESMERIVNGDISVQMNYRPHHEQFSKQLFNEAGGEERLFIQHKLYSAYIKHLWATDRRDEAMTRLGLLCKVVDMTTQCGHETVPCEALRVSCWLRYGDWKIASCPPGAMLTDSLATDVLVSYKRATDAQRSGSSYRAWHSWALINFRLAEQIRGNEKGKGGSNISKSPTIVRSHVIAAVKGFIYSISVGTKRWSASVQQDMLNLLSCLFKYGDLQDVASTINEGLDSIKIEAWLGVLPQLLARISIKSPAVRSVLHPLLVRLGAKHPQALMYPLSVLLKSPVLDRRVAAESLMVSLKAHSNALVDEALMVSSELIRVAILWLELWHEGLEDASRLYYGEGNVSGMLDVLIPLHTDLEKGASTRREQDFLKSFGRDLLDAHKHIKDYMRLITDSGQTIPTQGGFMSPNEAGRSGSPANAEAEAALNQAWDLYYTVFRRINKQLPGLTTLELDQCSPALHNARNLELGVPGSYRVDGSYIKIQRFITDVQVITSKQRPRKITIRGNDGKDYVFLLKGHEDLRQDERVMQLFGLVNALLARDQRTNKHDLNIQRYAIAPLSHNAGVVGWVPHCDTLHCLIRDYRESMKIPLNAENREMMALAPNYDSLTAMQKVEIFTEALERTSGKGNDIYEVLWIKSTNSEEWLERRTNFTRSLAVMSMVGYILGLGDRHPSNLMLDQISGRVLHIDFGDCFEVAMHREKFPEKVPFRLTRMLTRAMEVSGIEGSYRSTCERTMAVLRDNNDSLITMLEAFVYDPLISWRLLDQSSDQVAKEADTESSSTREGQEVGTSTSVQLEAHNATVAHTVLPGPIQEEQDEDGEDDDEDDVGDDGDEQGHEGGDKEDERNDTNDSSSDSDLGPHQADASSLGAITPAVKPSMSTTPYATSHAKSLQMYSEMRSLAANLSTSSRIASITGGTVDAALEQGSTARSRIDKSVRQQELLSMLDGDTTAANEEALNERALKVIRRVQDKLTGTDFPGEPLDVQDQVQRLIVQATSSENLCQLFIGWCAFW